MRTFTMWILVAGCGGSTGDDVAEAYRTAVEDGRALVEAHVAAVGAASTLEEITALEEDYSADWVHAHDQMSEHMDEMEDMGCDMGGHMDGGMGGMGDGMSAQEMLSEADDEVAEHMQQHEAHEDVADCHADEELHLEHMHAHLDDMEAFGGDPDDEDGDCSGMGPGR